MLVFHKPSFTVDLNISVELIVEVAVDVISDLCASVISCPLPFLFQSIYPSV